MDECKRILFVRSRSKYASCDNSLPVDKAVKKKNLDGNEVRSFYEDLVGLDTASSTSTSFATSWVESEPSQKHTNKSKKRKSDGGESISLKKAKKFELPGNPEISTSRLRQSKRKIKSSSSDRHHRVSGAQDVPAVRHHPDMQPSERSVHRWLRMVQDGRVDGVQGQLDEGMPVDVRDEYGWTALMCAAHAGHLPIVKLLITHGASTEHTNQKGHSVREVARKARRRNIIEELDRQKRGESSENPGPEEKQEEFYCQTCEEQFCDTTRTQHETSTLHLFNLKCQPVGTNYFLSEANKGFQMMLRHGWDKEQGLGPSGDGQKFPVKTVLKRDRQGLGKGQTQKAKVSHFGPNDKDAVKRPHKSNLRLERDSTMSKKQKAKKMRKERKKEIDFRRDFHFTDY